jgi:hypothetical protein
MPVISVNIPEPKAPKSDLLLPHLLREFASIQRRLQGLRQSTSDRASEQVLKTITRQQDSLVRAIERMIGQMGQMNVHNGKNDMLLDVMRGLRQTLADLPNDLRSALKSSYQAQARSTSVTVRPQVKVSMDNLSDKFDSLEAAIVRSNMRSRNRTFGSNY